MNSSCFAKLWLYIPTKKFSSQISLRNGFFLKPSHSLLEIQESVNIPRASTHVVSWRVGVDSKIRELLRFHKFCRRFQFHPCPFQPLPFYPRRLRQAKAISFCVLLPDIIYKKQKNFPPPILPFGEKWRSVVGDPHRRPPVAPSPVRAPSESTARIPEVVRRFTK